MRWWFNLDIELGQECCGWLLISHPTGLTCLCLSHYIDLGPSIVRPLITIKRSNLSNLMSGVTKLAYFACSMVWTDNNTLAWNAGESTIYPWRAKAGLEVWHMFSGITDQFRLLIVSQRMATVYGLCHKCVMCLDLPNWSYINSNCRTSQLWVLLGQCTALW